MTIGYRIVERFSPSWGETWDNYIKCFGLTHLAEVVGLDCSLCPSIIKDFSDEDWEFLVYWDHLFACFVDYEYALQRVCDTLDPTKHQVLAVVREPLPDDVAHAEIPGFTFLGHDLIEEPSGYSALTNCGGYEGAFTPNDLSPCGLVRAVSRAYQIRGELRRLYPEDHHANCAVWAIWRLDASEPPKGHIDGMKICEEG
jgi:hypothetical protein